ncbi:MAG: hypothetical protein Q4C87_00390 [Actinomycetaceae bacterium]|nr:hypothetical protein [Actinomycetaceae bacterium]
MAEYLRHPGACVNTLPDTAKGLVGLWAHCQMYGDLVTVERIYEKAILMPDAHIEEDYYCEWNIVLARAFLTIFDQEKARDCLGQARAAAGARTPSLHTRIHLFRTEFTLAEVLRYQEPRLLKTLATEEAPRLYAELGDFFDRAQQSADISEPETLYAALSSMDLVYADISFRSGHDTDKWSIIDKAQQVLASRGIETSGYFAARLHLLRARRHMAIGEIYEAAHIAENVATDYFDNPGIVIAARRLLAELSYSFGMPPEAAVQLQEVVRITRDCDLSSGTIGDLNTLASITQQLDQHHEANDYFELVRNICAACPPLKDVAIHMRIAQIYSLIHLAEAAVVYEAVNECVEHYRDQPPNKDYLGILHIGFQSAMQMSRPKEAADFMCEFLQLKKQVQIVRDPQYFLGIPDLMVATISSLHPNEILNSIHTLREIVFLVRKEYDGSVSPTSRQSMDPILGEIHYMWAMVLQRCAQSQEARINAYYAYQHYGFNGDHQRELRSLALLAGIHLEAQLTLEEPYWTSEIGQRFKELVATVTIPDDEHQHHMRILAALDTLKRTRWPRPRQ